MEGFNEIKKELKGISLEIMSKALPLMIMFKGEEGVEKANERGVEVDKVRNILLKMVEDSRKVTSELDSFSLEGIEESTGFLGEVWAGDVYDLVELEALVKLKEDMKRQCDEISIEGVLSKAKED